MAGRTPSISECSGLRVIRERAVLLVRPAGSDVGKRQALGPAGFELHGLSGRKVLNTHLHDGLRADHELVVVEGHLLSVDLDSHSVLRKLRPAGIGSQPHDERCRCIELAAEREFGVRIEHLAAPQRFRDEAGDVRRAGGRMCGSTAEDEAADCCARHHEGPCQHPACLHDPILHLFTLLGWPLARHL
jgi:hypothetical protein